MTTGGISREILAEIDEIWTKNRKQHDVHTSWRWSAIAPTLNDLFVVSLVDGDDRRPIAIWGAKKASPLSLPDGQMYRLDFIEVAPDLRGTNTSIAGTFAIATVAMRAREVGASGIVLAALPVDGVCRAYEARGAVKGAPKGWEFPEKLVPYIFGPEAMDRLKGFADEFETPEAP